MAYDVGYPSWLMTSDIPSWLMTSDILIVKDVVYTLIVRDGVYTSLLVTSIIPIIAHDVGYHLNIS